MPALSAARSDGRGSVGERAGKTRAMRTCEARWTAVNCGRLNRRTTSYAVGTMRTVMRVPAATDGGAESSTVLWARETLRARAG